MSGRPLALLNWSRCTGYLQPCLSIHPRRDDKTGSRAIKKIYGCDTVRSARDRPEWCVVQHATYAKPSPGSGQPSSSRSFLLLRQSQGPDRGHGLRSPPPRGRRPGSRNCGTKLTLTGPIQMRPVPSAERRIRSRRACTSAASISRSRMP